MAIKKLYANGDSWSFGAELGDNLPDELDYKYYNSWPMFLSQRMKIPQVINDSLGGGSCDRMFRKTVDYIRSQDTIEDTMFVLGWTSEERFEWPSKIKHTFHDGFDNDYWEDITYISMLFSNELSYGPNADSQHIDTVSRLNGLKNKWYRVRDYEGDLLKVKDYVYTLDELINAKGGQIYHFWVLGTPIPKYNLFDDTVNSIVERKQWPRKHHKHPNEETQQKIADIIYDAIQNRGK